MTPRWMMSVSPWNRASGSQVEATRRRRPVWLAPSLASVALNHHGGCIDPHQAWLVHRGLKTLGLRLRQGQDNARAICAALRAHPAVEWVRYPGADDYPQRDLVEQQMEGPGAVLCFGVKGGLEAGRRLMENVNGATLAVSLGG